MRDVAGRPLQGSMRAAAHGKALACLRRDAHGTVRSALARGRRSTRAGLRSGTAPGEGTCRGWSISRGCFYHTDVLLARTLSLHKRCNSTISTQSSGYDSAAARVVPSAEGEILDPVSPDGFQGNRKFPEMVCAACACVRMCVALSAGR